MSIVVDAVLLRVEIARRGWAGCDPAREARLSEATVSAALAGRPSATSSLNLIAETLSRTPVVEAIDRLIARPPRPDELG